MASAQPGITAETNTLDLTGVTWAPDGGVLGCEDDPCFIYTVTPVVTTEYYVSITDENGCFAIDTILVTVIYSNEVLVPNAFTPNGDNVNDLFQGIAYNLNSYHMVIYNRWGQLVYETNTADYYAGWDGKYRGRRTKKWALMYILWRHCSTPGSATQVKAASSSSDKINDPLKARYCTVLFIQHLPIGFS